MQHLCDEHAARWLSGVRNKTTIRHLLRLPQSRQGRYAVEPAEAGTDLTHLEKRLAPQQRAVHFTDIQLLQTGARTLHQTQKVVVELKGC